VGKNAMDVEKWLKVMQWLRDNDYFVRQAILQGRDDYAGYFAGRYPPVIYKIEVEDDYMDGEDNHG